ncbi:TnpV protein [Longicatena caecimuris]|uniref:Transposon-encoded protein TnpV n=1 Tax=Longicatena caecimuris TaxID=1796635 RepID=A0A4R3TBW6_9FIRM|nr:TnpV protein [Longicatena caecimuris]MCR1870472.1 TnpV protein [Longicatena caecimuris]MCU0103131.1 TnpV protein [Longicatena caecimuris]RJV89289.1 TnpV protein [Eubacterium sp. AF18-3]TCU58447.1 transposon-encoded protein TnpV [Longicatena caecimuris]
MDMPKHITDEKTGISYTLQGDYYLPNLVLLEQEHYELGRFARLKYRYLQNCHKALLASMRVDCSLNRYLHEVDEECEEVFSRLVKELSEKEGVTEKLKVNNQMEWVRRMNSIRNRVEEIILKEYVYV